MEVLFSSLGSLLTQLPVILVWLAGFILAVTRWQRHPKSSLFLTLALIIFAGQTLFKSIIDFALPVYMIQQGGSGSQMGIVFVGLGVLRAIVAAIAWILVLLAVFSEREEA